MAALTVCAGILLCGCTPPETVEQATTPSKSPKINVLVVVLDAFRADMASLYGYDDPTTPHLEEWAKRGTVFRRAYSQSTTTNTSAWSYMNGRYPYLSDNLNPMRNEDTPLAELMKKAGFATAAFSDNPYITRKMGFDRGFDEFDYRPMKDAPRPYKHEQDIQKRIKILAQNYPRTGDTSKELMADAGQWMANMQDSPWFCYVHIMRPHNPYYSPQPFLSQFVDMESVVPDDRDAFEFLHLEEQVAIGARDQTSDEPDEPDTIALVKSLYKGSIAYSDHLTHELLASLDESEILENTLVIIMSDHGEAFEDHGKFLHGRTYPYQEQVHVPLIILPPESMGDVIPSVDTAVGLVDLLPTLKDILELDVPQDLEGQSLLPLLRNDGADFRAHNYFQNLKPPSVGVLYGEHTMMTHLTPDYVEVLNREVYDLILDPGEQNNIYTEASKFDVLTALTGQYVSTRVGKLNLSDVEFTEQEIELMETLGYLN